MNMTIVQIFFSILFLNIVCIVFSKVKSHPLKNDAKDKKLAFLFVARAKMPLEEVWHEFFTWNANPSHYSIYIHRHGDFSFGEDSLFYNKEIPNTIPVTWGNVSIGLSIRLLVQEALKDPLNEWFSVASESCVPLIPFSVWRTSLLHQEKSLIDACPDTENEVSLARWDDALFKVGVTKELFRKSETWFAINRKHAEIFAYHSHQLDVGFLPVLSATEHMLPTVLAMHYQDNETVCNSGYVSVNWKEGHDSHPKLYFSDDITPELFVKLRSPPVGEDLLRSDMRCSSVPDVCHYIARKFSPTAKYALLENMASILSTESMPYTGNPWKFLNVELKRNKNFTNIYLVENGYLRLAPDVETVRYLHFDVTKATRFTDRDLYALKIGKNLPSAKDGNIYKPEDRNLVYVVKDGKRIVIPDIYSLFCFRLQSNKVQIFSSTDVDRMPISRIKLTPTPVTYPAIPQSERNDKKIAFIFLTKGYVALEEIWAEFFTYGANKSHYNIYVRSSTDYTFPTHSLFHGKEVRTNTEIKQGSIQIIQAVRLVMQQALKDPLNEWFCVIRDGSIPFMTFPKWRSALLAHDKSLINACPLSDSESDIHRWNVDLEQIGLSKAYWRRSGHEYALRRKHVELYVESSSMDSAWINIPNAVDHFIPSLLAMKRVDHETSCSDGFVHRYSEGRTSGSRVKTIAGDDLKDVFIEFYMIPKSTQSETVFDSFCSGVSDPYNSGGYICSFIGRKFAPSSKFALMEKISRLIGGTGKQKTEYESKCQIWSHMSNRIKTNSGKTEFYLVDNDVLRKIPDLDTQIYMHIDYGRAMPISSTDRIGLPLPSRRDGELYRSNDNKIYRLSNGHRNEITQPSVVLPKLNRTIDDIKLLNDYDMQMITLSSPIQDVVYTKGVWMNVY